jgi:hypothetical protein
LVLSNELSLFFYLLRRNAPVFPFNGQAVAFAKVNKFNDVPV